MWSIVYVLIILPFQPYPIPENIEDIMELSSDEDEPEDQDDEGIVTNVSSSENEFSD